MDLSKAWTRFFAGLATRPHHLTVLLATLVSFLKAARNGLCTTVHMTNNNARIERYSIFNLGRAGSRETLDMPFIFFTPVTSTEELAGMALISG
jgi:hypothetical protein